MNSLAIGDKLQAIKEIAIGGCEDIEVSEKIFDLCDEILGLVNSASCNCRRNSNSKENEPCCRCDSKHTNADRIRNMSDEELAEFLTTVTSDAICGSSWDYDGWIKELQSEAE
nr:MAG TPA: hypothetical protein [Bacteriophage sp.]